MFGCGPWKRGWRPLRPSWKYGMSSPGTALPWTAGTRRGRGAVRCRCRHDDRPGSSRVSRSGGHPRVGAWIRASVDAPRVQPHDRPCAHRGGRGRSVRDRLLAHRLLRGSPNQSDPERREPLAARSQKPEVGRHRAPESVPGNHARDRGFFTGASPRPRDRRSASGSTFAIRPAPDGPGRRFTARCWSCARRPTTSGPTRCGCPNTTSSMTAI